ncbi:MAG: PilZ domain-containing protein, partial [Candidatus Latescibacteria bacterium]|nr:PilZ domain-containing protein [Candidatus Latescibacterota bacterium]
VKLKNKLLNIFRLTKKEQTEKSAKVAKNAASITVTKGEKKDFSDRQVQPECYEEKQKKYMCVFKVNHQDIAIDISNKIDQKLKTFTEIGIQDNLYAVYIKPGYDMIQAKKIAVSVVQKDIYRERNVKWEFYNQIKDEKRKYQRLNLIKLDKQNIIETLIDDNQTEKPKISLHQSVFAVYDRNKSQYFGELADISQGGFKLICQMPVKVHTEYNLEADFMTIKNIEQKIQFDAECLYVNDTLGNDIYICCFKYTRIYLQGQETIKKFFNLYSKN